MCFYPPDLATDAQLPRHLMQMLDKNGMILLTVFIEAIQVCHRMHFHYFHENSNTIRMILTKRRGPAEGLRIIQVN